MPWQSGEHVHGVVSVLLGEEGLEREARLGAAALLGQDQDVGIPTSPDPLGVLPGCAVKSYWCKFTR